MQTDKNFSFSEVWLKKFFCRASRKEEEMGGKKLIDATVLALVSLCLGLAL